MHDNLLICFKPWRTAIGNLKKNLHNWSQFYIKLNWCKVDDCIQYPLKSSYSVRGAAVISVKLVWQISEWISNSLEKNPEKLVSEPWALYSRGQSPLNLRDVIILKDLQTRHIPTNTKLEVWTQYRLLLSFLGGYFSFSWGKRRFAKNPEIRKNTEKSQAYQLHKMKIPHKKTLYCIYKYERLTQLKAKSKLPLKNYLLVEIKYEPWPLHLGELIQHLKDLTPCCHDNSW